ncbi:hypothetical protein EYZ11_010352 [Aspergillus tanneri]|uniref:Uncharacterized protein n=1 Tax=Aspergillus tanneri TaxID=1220188 RepID=A0A4V3UN80_9EURO|nr:uncharacterized protein ATNIH1004_006501 [Aspergillus tanneri]KAA8647800.1 hypothetical protein ATNIH1004_006501 [Aspergillus tanneri]THC90194.1 hypothetical protein EYZ11_010352 [Aspergillus tanneri]
MTGEKSENPFKNLGHYSDSEHTNLSDRPVTPNTIGSASTAEPPPYTEDGIRTQESNAVPDPAPSQRNKPIAIPAIEPSFDSPFIRAYAPILTDYNLPRESFFAFLDQLNKVISSSPPLQVLDATGGILKSVPLLFPLHWIGEAVSGLANLGSHGVSKSRTDSHIRQANKDIFGPRGLKVEIAKLDALAHMASIPILDSQGKVSRKTPLLLRLLNGSDATVDESEDVDMQQRRIKILQPWIAELELDILPWTSKSKLTRFNAALKKRNTQNQPDSGHNGKTSLDDEETGLRKCLWLIIRPENA